jgi:hypothetical protein
MPNSFTEYSEATGKTVEQLRYYDDPSGVPEVHLRFTDGTSLSLKLCNALRVDAEFYRMHEGDVQTIKHYPKD